MKRWTFGLLGVLAAVACAEAESLGIEEVPEQVLVLQKSLETEGFTISGGSQVVPDPYKAESLIRRVAAQEGLDESEADLLVARMKENWDRKAEAEKKEDR